MKAAIVHDYLIQMGGAEKVVDALHAIYPDAPVYTSIYDKQSTPNSYRNWDIRTSFLQRLPLKRITNRAVLLLYPLAFESFDFSEYDVVISSSSAFAKGVITQPNTAHICYCHSPMRFAWSTQNYLKNERVSWPLRALLTPGTHYLRMWDAVTSTRVDRFIANSSIVAKRISKYYGASSETIYPPVDTARFSIAKNIGNYYVIVARAAPYRRLDLAIDACTRLKIPLKLAGTGRQLRDLRARAGANVEFLGRVSDSELPGLLARSKGYIMPGEEDFGIAPVEANASGRPVIAFAAGGALDSQIDGKTGVLFKEQSVDCLCDALERAEATKFEPETIRTHAQQFDTCVFQDKIKAVVKRTVNREVTNHP